MDNPKFASFIQNLPGYNPNKVLVITIQENRTTSCTSLIIDLSTNAQLDNYPIEATNDYKETIVSKFNVAYNFFDPISFSNVTALGDDDGIHNDSFPFCCNAVSTYKNRRLEKEKAFTDFKNKTGSQPYVYEVKKQVNNGPLVWTKYFKLTDSTINEIRDKEFTSKVHSFKNYVCNRHNFFYMVDLYHDSNTTHGNYHHMRLMPFKKINEAVLQEFIALLL